MQFNQNLIFKRLGEKTGYLSGYFLFSTVLYFIICVLNKTLEHWQYHEFLAITLLLTIIGAILKRTLK